MSVKIIYKNLLFQHRKSTIIKHYKNELEGIIQKKGEKLKPISDEYRNKIKEFYRRFGIKSVDTSWHEFIYSVTGKEDVRYIPEDLYHYFIEPVYTHGDNSLENKSFMELILPPPLVAFPRNVIYCMDSILFDSNRNTISERQALQIISNYKELIIKPSVVTGSGRGVQIIDNTLNDLSEFGDNFVIQERIIQDDNHSKFNTTSVNTEKIISMVEGNEVSILTSILRVGAPGSITDTASKGDGFSVGILPDGKLNSIGYTLTGDKVSADFSGRLLEKCSSPEHEEIIEIIKKCHIQIPYFKIISWDFAISNEHKPILIEYNLNYPDVLIYQLSNGPLFAEKTEEKLEECKELNKKRKSYLFT